MALDARYSSAFCSAVRNGAGASSTSFWWRRCSEQSRVETITTLPCRSARHWVSTCRGLSRYCSTKHSPRPKAATASRTAESYSSGISSSVRATFRPRPPPPNAALMATGRPCSVAKATTSSAPDTSSRVAGDQRGTGALCHVPGGDLVTEVADGLRRRADPGQARVDDGLGEVGVLGEEAVARVDGVRTGVGGCLQHLGDVQVAGAGGVAAERVRLVGRADVQRIPVRLGVDGDAGDTGIRAGPGDADGDFSAVGDEHLAHNGSLLEPRRV